MYMKTTLCLILLLLGLVLSSCEEQQSPPPEDLLSSTEMIGILKDLHIADAGVTRVKMPITERDSRRDKLYTMVMEHHGVAKEQFYKSYQYYLLLPDTMDVMYHKIIEELNQMVPEEQGRMHDLKQKERAEEEQDFEDMPKLPKPPSGKTKMKKKQN